MTTRCLSSYAPQVLGLLICFVSFGAYMHLSPFASESDDRLAQICQVQIFFSLLAGVVLFGNPPEMDQVDLNARSEAIGVILVIMLAVPPIVAVVGSNPLTTKVLFHPQRRKKLFKMLDKYLYEPVALWRLELRVGAPRGASLRRARKIKAKLGKRLEQALAEQPPQDLANAGLETVEASAAAVAWAVEHRSEYQLRAALDEPLAFLSRTESARKKMLAGSATSTSQAPDSPMEQFSVGVGASSKRQGGQHLMRLRAAGQMKATSRAPIKVTQVSLDIEAGASSTSSAQVDAAEKGAEGDHDHDVTEAHYLHI